MSSFLHICYIPTDHVGYFVAITPNEFGWQNVFFSIFLAPNHNPTCLSTKCYTAGGCDWHMIDIKSRLSFGLVLVERHYNLWTNFFPGVFPQAPIIPVKYYVAGAENNAIFWRKSSFSPPLPQLKAPRGRNKIAPLLYKSGTKHWRHVAWQNVFRKRDGTVFNKLSKLL